MREMWKTFRTQKLSVQTWGIIVYEESNWAENSSKAITKVEEARRIEREKFVRKNTNE